jgi:hypothetical protein
MAAERALLLRQIAPTVRLGTGFANGITATPLVAP